VRIEQLYPFPEDLLGKILKRYPQAEAVWVQEEPKNMGAWRFVDATVREQMEVSLTYVGRDANASPAVASTKMHAQEQEKIMITAKKDGYIVGHNNAPVVSQGDALFHIAY